MSSVITYVLKEPLKQMVNLPKNTRKVAIKKVGQGKQRALINATKENYFLRLNKYFLDNC